MKRSLPALAIDHPITTIMLLVTLVGLGCICWRLIPIEFTIKLNFPMLYCYIPYPGAAPEQVEREVAEVAEREFWTIPRLKTLSTASSLGGCSVMLRFDWDTDMIAALADLRDRMERLKLKLPGDIERVYIRKYASQDWPILRFALFTDQNEDELAHLARTQVRSRLMRVPGVAEVEVSGRPVEEVYVSFDQNALRSLNLSISSVIGVLQTGNLNVSLGHLADGGSKYYVRALGEYGSMEDLENLVIGPNSVRLKDVARVEMRSPAGVDSFAIDGKKGVFLRVLKESEANTLATCEAVKKELDALLAEPVFQHVDRYTFQDQSAVIRFAVNGLMQSGLYGGLVALAVLFLFLRRLRATVLVALATPLSLVAAFVYLYFRGASLNWVTLASMIVSLGMLVDNAIVVMENIQRLNQLGPDRRKNAQQGAAEVGMAITASTLTTIVVFVPVFYLEPGELTIGMREFAGPVSISLLASLVIALTMIPLAASRMSDRHRHGNRRVLQRLRGGDARAGVAAPRTAPMHPLLRAREAYGQTIQAVLENRLASTLALGAIVAVTAWLPFQHVGTQQMPTMDERETQIRVQFDRNYDRDMARDAFDMLTSAIEARRDELGIRNLYVDYGARGGVIRTFLTKTDELPPGQHIPYTTEQVRDILSQQLPALVPGGRLEFDVAQSGRSDAKSLTLLVRGKEAAHVAEIAERFQARLSLMPEIKEVRTNQERAEEELQLQIDEDLALQAGVTPLTVARTVDFALRGIRLPYIKQGGREIPVQARFGDEDRQTRANLDNLALFGNTGKLVPLNNFSTLSKAHYPSTLYRENGKSVVRLTLYVSTRNLTRVEAGLARVLDSFALPQGYSIELGEEMTELERTQRNFGQALTLAIILVYLVMAALFESFLLPFSILTTVPLAFVGVYWTMYLTNTPMDSVSFIGSVMMCGVIVNNGIVIVDRINQLRLQGLPRTRAVVTASLDRFRPVMMTALTTILGCVPLAIGTRGGQDALNSLGRALVGGLTVGTLLTLLVVPLFYSLIDDMQLWGLRYVCCLARLSGGIRRLHKARGPVS